MFLLLMLVAVQVAVTLYARSAVGAAAFDAARIAAGADGLDHDALARAEARARSVLGAAGEQAEFTWDLDDQSAVALTVRVPTPTILPPALRVDGGATERTVRLRREQVIAP